MLKLNSSISRAPDFGIFPGQAQTTTANGMEFSDLPDIDSWASAMSVDEKLLYSFITDLSNPSDNFFNPEGMVLLFTDYEIRRIIFEVYLKLKCPIEKEDLLQRFKTMVEDSPIISFNYDCLVEKIFDTHLLFNYAESKSLQDINHLILKPHGSLGWMVTKSYFQKDGTIEVKERKIKKDTDELGFYSNLEDGDLLINKSPIIIPMSPGKENFVSSIDPSRIKLWNDGYPNAKREFIDCVVSYIKMLDVIRKAERVVFIGYSFPVTDYETAALLNLAFNSSNRKECHICVKGNDIPNLNLTCDGITYYAEGFEHFIEKFV